MAGVSVLPFVDTGRGNLSVWDGGLFDLMSLLERQRELRREWESMWVPETVLRVSYGVFFGSSE